MNRKGLIAAKAAGLLVFSAALAAAVACACSAQEAGSLRIAPEQWRFHVGDDLRCGALDDAGCTLQPSSKDAYTGNQYFWKRVEVTLPDELRKTSQLGLTAADTTLAYEV